MTKLIHEWTTKRTEGTESTPAATALAAPAAAEEEEEEESAAGDTGGAGREAKVIDQSRSAEEQIVGRTPCREAKMI